MSNFLFCTNETTSSSDFEREFKAYTEKSPDSFALQLNRENKLSRKMTNQTFLPKMHIILILDFILF